MATILEGLTQALSPSATRDIGKAVGLKDDLVSKGIDVVGPLITTALANQASTAGGLADLMKLLPKEDTSAMLGNLSNLVKGGVGSAAVSSVFGSGASAVGATLDRVLGFKASSLLTVATPLVLGVVSKIAGEKKLDAKGVAQLLASEAAEVQNTGGQTARLVGEAVDTGRKAADTKAKYSAVQWESVRLAPVAAAHVVMMADKSGPIGATKEISAAAGAIDDSKKGASPASVLNLAFETDYSADEFSKFAKGGTRADALATVRDAIGVVERNNPTDAPTFRRLLADVATRVASASKEGGILGFGGTLVSPAEQAAIDEINAVIGNR